MTDQPVTDTPAPEAATPPTTWRSREIWNMLTRDERAMAVESFWEGDYREEQEQAERYLAQRLKSRPKSVRRLSVKRKTEYMLAIVMPVIPEFIDAILISYHLRYCSDMMTTFLDVLGIPHTKGEIAHDAELTAPAMEALEAACEALEARFEKRAAWIYIASLAALDRPIWGGLEPWIERWHAQIAATPAEPAPAESASA